MTEDQILYAGLEALKRLTAIALSDTGQSKRVADFLLAWHNACENGGWDPTDLWSVDERVAADILAVLALINQIRRYPGDYEEGRAIEHVWQLWRGGKS